MNSHEVKLLVRKVDSYDLSITTVYQFYRWFWHGCPQCYKSDCKNEIRRMTIGELYINSIKFEDELNANGYNLVTIWKYNLTEDIKNIKVNFIAKPKARDALVWGRTEGFKLFYKIEKFSDDNKQH